MRRIKRLFYISVIAIMALLYAAPMIQADEVKTLPGSFTASGYNNPTEITDLVLLPGDSSNNTPIQQGTILYPQIEYRIQFTLSDLDTLADLESVMVKWFWDDADVLDVDQVFGSSANNDTDDTGEAYVWEWTKEIVNDAPVITKGTVYKTGYDSNNTSWGDDLDSSYPDASFDYTQEITIFTIKVLGSKIAHLAENNTWNVAVYVDDGDVTEGEYSFEVLSGFSMGWYGEINVPGGTEFDWGVVEHDSTYSDHPAAVVNDVNFISNSYYQQNIYADQYWESDIYHPVTGVMYLGELDNTGDTDGVQEFALRAHEDSVYANSIQVWDYSRSLGISDGATPEAGDDYDYNMWLKIADHFQNGTYDGLIYLRISDPQYLVWNVTQDELYTSTQNAVDAASHGDELKFVREPQSSIGTIYIDMDNYYSGGSSLLTFNIDKHDVTGNLNISADYTGTLNITGSGSLDGNMVIGGEGLSVNNTTDIDGYVELNNISYSSGYTADGIHTEGIYMDGMGRLTLSDDAVDQTVTVRTDRRVILNGAVKDVIMAYSDANIRVEGDVDSITANTKNEIYMADYSSVGTIDITGNYYSKIQKEVNADFDSATITGTKTSLDYTEYLDLVINYTQDTHYSTIQAAIDAANPNDVIRLTESVFTEDLVIDVESLSIQGLQYDHTYWAGNEDYYRGYSTVSGSVSVNADNVNVNGVYLNMVNDTLTTAFDNLTFKYNRVDHSGATNVIELTSTNQTNIYNNDFSGLGASQVISLRGDITNLSVTSNNFDVYYGSFNYGIYAGNTTSISTSTIQSNTFYGFDVEAIKVSQNSINTYTISSNNFYNNYIGIHLNQDGISPTYTSLEVTNNDFQSNIYGIVISGEDYPIAVYDTNEFWNNSWHIKGDSTNNINVATVLSNNTFVYDTLYDPDLLGIRPYTSYDFVNIELDKGYETLQRAVDDAETNNYIYVKATTLSSKTYNLTATLHITTDNITVYTEDSHTYQNDYYPSILSYSGVDNTPTMIIEADNVTIENFYIRRYNGTSDASAIVVAGSNVTLDAIVVYGSGDVSTGITIQNGYTNFDTNLSGVTVSNSTIYGGFNEAISLETPQGTGTLSVSITSNTFNDSDTGVNVDKTTSAIYASISGNTFNDQTIDVSDLDAQLNLQTIRTSNTFYDTSDPYNTVVRSVYEKDNTLTSTGIEIFNNDFIKAYSSLQDAIDDAETGDTIQVVAGTYTDDEISIDGTLLIDVDGLTITPVSGVVLFELTTELTSDFITINSPNVEINNIDFTLSHSSSDAIMVVVNKDNVTLTSVDLTTPATDSYIYVNDGENRDFELQYVNFYGAGENAVTFMIDSDTSDMISTIQYTYANGTLSGSFVEIIAQDNILTRLNQISLTLSNVTNSTPVYTPNIPTYFSTLTTHTDMKDFIVTNYVELGISGVTMTAFNDLGSESARQQYIITGLITHNDEPQTYSDVATLFADYVAAEEVHNMIANLDSVIDTTLEDESSIESVRTYYNDLSSTQKAYVSNLTDLTDVEAEITRLSNAVSTFNTTHSTALNLTTDDVQISNSSIITTAFDAYDSLDNKSKAELTTEYNLLVALRNKIADLGQMKSDFLSDHSTVLALSTTTIALGDESILVAAENAYLALSNQEKNELTTESTKLTSLRTAFNALVNSVASFQSTHATVLALSTTTIALGDESILVAAENAYLALSDQQKNELTTESTKLTSLRTAFNALVNSVASFRTTHATVLALSTTTIAISDESILEAAENAYGNLSDQQKNELTTESTKLTSLRTAFNALETSVGSFQSIYSNILNETDETIQFSDQTELTNALGDYNSYSNQLKAELISEYTTLLDLQSKLTSMTTTYNNYISTYSDLWNLTTGTVVYETHNTDIQNALSDYSGFDPRIQALLNDEHNILTTLNNHLNT
jgi:hypothetical protein